MSEKSIIKGSALERELTEHIHRAFNEIKESERKKDLDETFREEERRLKEELLNVINFEAINAKEDRVQEVREEELRKILAGNEIDKIKQLFEVAYVKGLYYATELCKKTQDPFLLDLFHDILAKDGFYKRFLKSKSSFRQYEPRLFDYVLFLVKSPRYNKPDRNLQGDDFRKDIAKFEEILSNFFTFYEKDPIKRFIFGGNCIVLEISSQMGKEEIYFYVSAPKIFESHVKKYIQGVYPEMEIIKVPEDYIIFEPVGYVRGGYMKLQKSDYLPISTYQNLAQDPLSTITNVFSQIKIHDGLSLQIVLKSHVGEFYYKGNLVIERLKQGKKLHEALDSVSFSVGKLVRQAVKEIFWGKPKEAPEKEDKQRMTIDETLIKKIESKISKKLFETNIRIMASSENKDEAIRLFSNLCGAFGQFSLSGSNEFQIRELSGKKLEKLIYDYSFRRFDKSQNNILNTEEITSLYHFPLAHIKSPNISWRKSGEAPPPSVLSREGENMIGEVVYRGEKFPVNFVSKDDRRRHFYVIGQTGTGKTSLFRQMIRQDIVKGYGVGVIDPHGDLIEATLSYIPKNRIEDVVLFEPFDLSNPMGLNMLEWEVPEQKDFAVQEMIAIFHKLFPPEIIGPMFEHYMRNAMLALMADKDNPGTLVEIPRIFTDDDFMEAKLAKVQDPLVRNFWEKEWRKTTGSTKSDMLGYVVSKVGRFVENEMMRNIIGQGKSSFNFEEILNDGKIFLANLSKGQTGEVNSSLLGLILVSKLQMAAMKRAYLKEEERKDFYLYLDEFQNFTTDSIATILSEARKYRLNLILAHQFIPQLPDYVRDAVLGNVGSICAFRVGVEDAEFLEKQFEPEFSRFDLVNLDNFNAIVRMMVNNSVSPPFRLQTVRPLDGDKSIVDQLKKLAKLKFARRKEVVEKEIVERSRLLD